VRGKRSDETKGKVVCCTLTASKVIFLFGSAFFLVPSFAFKKRKAKANVCIKMCSKQAVSSTIIWIFRCFSTPTYSSALALTFLRIESICTHVQIWRDWRFKAAKILLYIYIYGSYTCRSINISWYIYIYIYIYICTQHLICKLTWRLKK